MSKALLFGGLLWAVCAGQTLAEPSTRLAWTPETLERVENGDAARGKQAAESCAACHAPGPAPAGSQFPALHGQLAAYLYKQLHDYKDGSRASPIMQGIAAGLSDQAMADIAVWYSQQAPIPGTKEPVAESAVALVSKGDGRRILPPCKVCHEADGRGQRIDMPALAGQNAAYMEQTLLDYRSGARHNDLYGRMRDISAQLSVEEIKALAKYYAGLKR